jgi:hypothetical protein
MLLIKRPFCLDDFGSEVDVQMTSSEWKEAASLARQQAFNPGKKRLGQQSLTAA